jgi:hypothetical protein
VTSLLKTILPGYMSKWGGKRGSDLREKVSATKEGVVGSIKLHNEEFHH